MPFYQSTTINKDGKVVRERRSCRKHYHKREDTSFRDGQTSNPKTQGTLKTYNALGVYKGARIMSAEQKIRKQHTKEIELNYSSPVDRRANPQLAHLKR